MEIIETPKLFAKAAFGGLGRFLLRKEILYSFHEP